MCRGIDILVATPGRLIHGNKSQRQREAALAEFRVGHIRGLVATDIAARGIDVDCVTHVVNYDLPVTPARAEYPFIRQMPSGRTLRPPLHRGYSVRIRFAKIEGKR